MRMNTKVVVNPEVLTTLVDDELGLMNVNKGNYYTLNKIGKAIWYLIEQEKSVEELIEILIKQFQVEKNICLEDTVEVLNLMDSQGLICVREEK